jgi:hypothetical protein
MRGVPDPDGETVALLSIKQMREYPLAATVPGQLVPSYKSIAHWISSYLMSSHPELGRAGDVCPFTAQASRLDTIRVGVCDASSAEITRVKSIMRYCFAQLARIPCPRSMEHFRTIIVGFPNIQDDENGMQTLRAVQDKLKFYCLRRGLMIGRFHAGSADRGLWNPDFRPLRSPIPLLAIRHLVENDAAFAARHPLLIPAYVCKYPLAGCKRLLALYGMVNGSL